MALQTTPIEDEAKNVVGIILKFCIRNSRITLFIIGNFKNQMWSLTSLRFQIHVTNFLHVDTFYNCFPVIYKKIAFWLKFFKIEIDIYITQGQNRTKVL